MGFLILNGAAPIPAFLVSINPCRRSGQMFGSMLQFTRHPLKARAKIFPKQPSNDGGQPTIQHKYRLVVRLIRANGRNPVLAITTKQRPNGLHTVFKQSAWCDLMDTLGLFDYPSPEIHRHGDWRSGSQLGLARRRKAVPLAVVLKASDNPPDAFHGRCYLMIENKL